MSDRLAHSRKAQVGHDTKRCNNMLVPHVVSAVHIPDLSAFDWTSFRKLSFHFFEVESVCIGVDAYLVALGEVAGEQFRRKPVLKSLLNGAF